MTISFKGKRPYVCNHNREAATPSSRSCFAVRSAEAAHFKADLRCRRPIPVRCAAQSRNVQFSLWSHCQRCFPWGTPAHPPPASVGLEVTRQARHQARARLEGDGELWSLAAALGCWVERPSSPPVKYRRNGPGLPVTCFSNFSIRLPTAAWT